MAPKEPVIDDSRLTIILMKYVALATKSICVKVFEHLSLTALALSLLHWHICWRHIHVRQCCGYASFRVFCRVRSCHMVLQIINSRFFFAFCEHNCFTLILLQHSLWLDINAVDVCEVLLRSLYRLSEVCTLSHSFRLLLSGDLKTVQGAMSTHWRRSIELPPSILFTHLSPSLSCVEPSAFLVQK